MTVTVVELLELPSEFRAFGRGIGREGEKGNGKNKKVEAR